MYQFSITSLHCRLLGLDFSEGRLDALTCPRTHWKNMSPTASPLHTHSLYSIAEFAFPLPSSETFKVKFDHDIVRMGRWRYYQTHVLARTPYNFSTSNEPDYIARIKSKKCFFYRETYVALQPMTWAMPGIFFIWVNSITWIWAHSLVFNCSLIWCRKALLDLTLRLSFFSNPDSISEILEAGRRTSESSLNVDCCLS